MEACPPASHPARRRWRPREWLPLLPLCALASCGGHRPLATQGGYPRYDAPGPPGDPWGPYIREAAERFIVPERWIREVMRQESGGREYLRGQPITSDAGATGLMQLMPATYAELRQRYSLGPDPYDPHDNILAGSAYIAELYGRYGSPAFLAAYNAGPHRLDTYMAGSAGLPNATIDYLASIAPRLGAARPMTGPLAAYADTGQAIEVAQASPRPPSAYVPHEFTRPPAPGCWQDPNAAYDPDAPCRPPPPPPAPAQVASTGTTPGTVLWGQDAPQAAPPARTFAFMPSAAAATIQPAMASGGWAVQVGAFANPSLARQTADAARARAPRELANTHLVLGTTAPFGGQVLYRARLAGLSAGTAAAACGELEAQRLACVTVPPGG